MPDQLRTTKCVTDHLHRMLCTNMYGLSPTQIQTRFIPFLYSLKIQLIYRKQRVGEKERKENVWKDHKSNGRQEERYGSEQDIIHNTCRMQSESC